MTKQLAALRQRRDSVLAEQTADMRELLENSIDPHKASELIHKIVQSVGEYQELRRIIDAEIERSRHHWWERIFAP